MIAAYSVNFFEFAKRSYTEPFRELDVISRWIIRLLTEVGYYICVKQSYLTPIVKKQSTLNVDQDKPEQLLPALMKHEGHISLYIRVLFLTYFFAP